MLKLSALFVLELAVAVSPPVLPETSELLSTSRPDIAPLGEPNLLLRNVWPAGGVHAVVALVLSAQ